MHSYTKINQSTKIFLFIMLFVIILQTLLLILCTRIYLFMVPLEIKKQPWRAVRMDWMTFEVKVGLPLLTVVESLFVCVHIQLG